MHFFINLTLKHNWTKELGTSLVSKGILFLIQKKLEEVPSKQAGLKLFEYSSVGNEAN